MNKENNLLQGSIFKGLTSFAVPILFSQLLQSLYGAVDMLIVGKFATTPDVSGVATGSGVMQTFTITLNCLALGVTVIVGREIGRGNKQNAGKAIGAGIVLFAMITAIMTALMTLTADW